MNVNETVLVKLTPHGHQCLAKNLREIPGCEHIDHRELHRTRPDGYTEFQLWVLMHEFGRHMYNGAKACFERGQVIFPHETQDTAPPGS